MESSPEKPKRRLLLADDSVTIRKVVELTFAEEGIEVISAGDGDMAMEKFVEQTPDIVLVDVEMPGSSGYQICEMIKSDESTHHIPVLLLVGSFEPFDQTAAERARADGFLTKPFHSIRELVSKVNELLGIADEVEPPAAETEDIDDLYVSSFAETMPLVNETAEEDLTTASFEVAADHDDAAFGQDFVASEENDDDLGDPSFDDEMVETLRPTAAGSENGHVSMSNAEPVGSDFDWSPAGIVASHSPTIRDVERDEPILEEIEGSLASALGTSQSHALEGAERDVPLLEVIDDALGATSAAPAVYGSTADTAEFPSQFSEHQSGSTPDEAVLRADPTEEIIERITRRVMERLSDRVVRDVAQEAVPRIAEKLIREALEEESKT